MIRTTPPHLVAVCTVLVALFATDAAADSSATCASDAMIVFDASGSMNASDFPDGAPSRIDRVRQALTKFLPRVSKTRNLGLVIYGPGSHKDACENIDLRFKPMPNAGSRIMSEIERVIPDGRTPLTKSVRTAADAFGAARKSATVVLLTDGEETCGGDPCKLARELHASSPNLVVDVIGYKLQSLDGRPPVSGAKCLADETQGYNVTAETLDELVAALEKTLGCPSIAWHDAVAPGTSATVR